MSNVTFSPPVNKLGDPIIRCEYCKKIIPDEVNEGLLSSDPDFKAIRLYQCCDECERRHFSVMELQVLFKTKWVNIDYQKAVNAGKTDKYWKGRGKL